MIGVRHSWFSGLAVIAQESSSINIHRTQSRALEPPNNSREGKQCRGAIRFIADFQTSLNLALPRTNVILGDHG